MTLPVTGPGPKRKEPGARNPNRLYYERYDGVPLTAEYRQKYPGIAK